MTSVPPSPEHPKGDEELTELPEGEFDIDLNPGISDEDEPMSDGTASRNRSTQNSTNRDQRQEISEAHEISNEDDIIVPSLTLSFEEVYDDVKSEFKAHEPISYTQQSKFINYVDEQLLKLQRKFIKAQSGQSPYDAPVLISDLLQILKLIWLSISSKRVDNIEYLVKVLSDMEDYIEFYKSIDSQSGVFNLVQYLDVRICLLYDMKLLSSTQFVRSLSIVSRLRMAIISKIFRTDDYTIELEVSKIFEGILDRS